MTASPSRAPSARWLVAALAGLLGLSLLSVPTAESLQPQQVEDPVNACPDETNPAAPFDDRDSIPDVHVSNVDCAFNNDITVGFTDDTFRPRQPVRRDQFASFLVRTMRAGDVDLPAAEDQGFEDIEGNPHEDNINILAETGITRGTSQNRYSPRQFMPRDQIGSFILRAAAFIEDVSLESLQRDEGPFTDVPEDNVHEENINGARHFNLTVGRTSTTYEPASLTRRDQMASFLIRLLASLRADGGLIEPTELVTDITIDEDDQLALNEPGTEHSVSVTATDRIGDAVENARVRFEVYRGDYEPETDVRNLQAETTTVEFSGPVEQGVETTGSDGRATFTYTGPDERAIDAIVACTPVAAQTCQVEDEDPDTEGTQFTGKPSVGAETNATAFKIWSFTAEQASATAFGASVESVVDPLPDVAVEVPEDDDIRADEDASLLDLDLESLGSAGVTRVRAIADLIFGGARGRAETGDLTLLEDDVTGEPLIEAEAIHAVSTSACPDPEATDAEEASEGSRFVDLRIGDTEVPVNPAPNTEIGIDGVAVVTVRQVEQGVNERGEQETTVRGLHVDLLDGTEIVIAEAQAGVQCDEEG